MIVILLSWLYILLTSVLVGLLSAKIFKINSQSSIELSILGLFSTSIMSLIWAFFFPINELFYGLYLLFVLVIGFYLKNDLRNILRAKIQFIKYIDFKILLFAILFVLILAIQTASRPTLPDNESYYIQTIKWINEYGLVKGLGNLHLFFAQTSAWHVLQSSYNFNFFTEKLASLSGFLSCLLVLFSFKNLHLYFIEKKNLYLFFALVPVFLILFFPLINVPSPDVATYGISLIVFFLFLNSDTSKENNFRLIVLLCTFLILIKVTNLPLLLIPLIFFFSEKEIKIKNNLFLVTATSFYFGLLFAKNALLTGYIFYPIHSFGVWNDFYKIPNSVLAFFYSDTMRYNFFIDPVTFKNSTFLFIVKQWLFRSYSDLFFNASILFCFVIMPFLIRKERVNSKIWIVYFVLLLQFILLVFSSPQYRFFLGTILFFFAFIASFILNSKFNMYLSLLVSLLILCVYTFVPQVFSGISSNKIITSRSAFSVENLVVTSKRTSLNTNFELTKKQNLNYFSPTNPDLFWETGNGPLPCVNQKQVDYFENYFQVIPQQITLDLKDGFYSMKLIKP
jgi:hypothetical protein